MLNFARNLMGSCSLLWDFGICSSSSGAKSAETMKKSWKSGQVDGRETRFSHIESIPLFPCVQLADIAGRKMDVSAKHPRALCLWGHKITFLCSTGGSSINVRECNLVSKPGNFELCATTTLTQKCSYFTKCWSKTNCYF